VLGPHIFSSVTPGQGRCARIQIPLRLAWALTVHKAQGCANRSPRSTDKHSTPFLLTTDQLTKQTNTPRVAPFWLRASLDLVELHLGDARAPGQVYVGLSRVRSLAGLRLAQPLHPSNVRTAAAVRAFERAFDPPKPGLPRRRCGGRCVLFGGRFG
jgi:hypothetical protein